MKWKSAGFALTVCSTLVTTQADAQQSVSRTDVHAIFAKNHEEVGQTITAGKEDAIISTVARSPRAVELKQDVTIGAIGSGVDFKAGAVLFGRYDKTVWTYCGITSLNAESRVASAAALGVLTAGFSLLLEPARGQDFNCLYDFDNDGVFDSGWGAGAAISDDSMIAFNLSKKSLSTNPAYERIDYTKGPGMPITIRWQKNKRAATITFKTHLSGRAISTATKPIPAIGGDPVEVELSGTKFMLNSYDAESETVNVTIEEGFDESYVRIPATRIISTQYYYY